MFVFQQIAGFVLLLLLGKKNGRTLLINLFCVDYMENIIKDFKKLFEGGSITLTKLGNAYVVSVKKFDVSTGIETNSDVFSLDPVVISKLKIEQSSQNLLKEISDNYYSYVYLAIHSKIIKI